MTEAELQEIEAKVCGIFYTGPTMKEVRKLIELARFALKSREALEDISGEQTCVCKLNPYVDGPIPCETCQLRALLATYPEVRK